MISTILHYSTIDFRFLDTNLTQLSKVSDEIIIPICDHLFDGEPEEQELLVKTYEIAAKYPKCSVYLFEWQGPKNNPGYYHNLSRALGTSVAKNDWLLFVDTDEIIDDSFKEWFEKNKTSQTNGYWLTCYWYFREPIYQATRTEAAGLLVRKKYCNWDLEIRDERQQLFNSIPYFLDGNYTPILSEEGTPIVHHFSWVRNKKEMLKKVQNWGHKYDKDWKSLVEEEFSRSFNGTDFVHGYSYKVVENKFNI